MVAASGSRLPEENAVEALKTQLLSLAEVVIPNTRGAGCTLSGAIASNLAKGLELEKAVRQAKEYISGALAAMLDLGRGRGVSELFFGASQGYFPLFKKRD